jgi:hypothetical protein
MMRVAVRRRGDDDGDAIATIFYFYYEGYILHVVSKQLPQRRYFGYEKDPKTPWIL